MVDVLQLLITLSCRLTGDLYIRQYTEMLLLSDMLAYQFGSVGTFQAGLARCLEPCRKRYAQVPSGKGHVGLQCITCVVSA